MSDPAPDSGGFTFHVGNSRVLREVTRSGQCEVKVILFTMPRLMSINITLANGVGADTRSVHSHDIKISSALELLDSIVFGKGTISAILKNTKSNFQGILLNGLTKKVLQFAGLKASSRFESVVEHVSRMAKLDSIFRTKTVRGCPRMASEGQPVLALLRSEELQRLQL
ncbi:hypothetical protein J6590_026321 [Homalodisca vitripennis]|nr:hypothetical protein J6590_026321 [Homalodisca vitripennis]